jgi:lysophospholipid acyltransferase (LPLAT)-like uncharacterized protein
MEPMENSLPMSLRLSGLVASHAIRAWMSTLEYRTLYYDPSVDARLGCDQPRIYVFWHENILVPLYLRGHCNLAMLLSKHRDANVLARVAYHMGFDCVRGSTNRGSAAALLDMSRRGRHMHLAITPDGPRGPRRKLAIGPVYLASRLGLPIVPLGFGADRPWRAKSWDRFAVPRPFSQVRGVIGPAVYVPADLDREQLELRRQGVERLLTDLTLESEDWAASGARRPGEVVIRSQARERRPRQIMACSEPPAMVDFPETTAQESNPGLRISA